MNELFKWIIRLRFSQIEEIKQRPIELQQRWFEYLISSGLNTAWGKSHQFDSIKTLADFQKSVPLQSYETLKPFIDKAINAEEDVLWKGKTNWFAKSSGTTSDRSKFIPVTEESLFENHYKAGKDLLANYYETVPTARLFSGKTLIVGGSAQINELSDDSYLGDLSAIILKNLPWWVEMKRTPSREIALMSDWEPKIEKMALETMEEDVRILSGVPSWTLVLCQRILKIKKAKHLLEVWPNLELFMHGGVNFEPYRAEFEKIIPSDKMQYVETYNASEGMFGFQDLPELNEMLLLLDHGIFYEFIPMKSFNDLESSDAIGLQDVKVGENYALVISTNGGLWRYVVGDTVRFTSTFPFRFKITGRTKSFINAFGEELIVDNAENAIAKTCLETNTQVMNYTVAPIFMQFGPESNKGQHEWIIEFIKAPEDLEKFTTLLDQNLRSINSDYDAKRAKDLAVLAPKIHVAPISTFDKWLTSKGKLGGQHKIPRLCNDRSILEEILNYLK